MPTTSRDCVGFTACSNEPTIRSYIKRIYRKLLRLPAKGQIPLKMAWWWQRSRTEGSSTSLKHNGLAKRMDSDRLLRRTTHKTRTKPKKQDNTKKTPTKKPAPCT